jgi:hypothetical protein
MPSLRFKTANISSFSNDAPAYILGKNGFATDMGTIPVLVTAVNKIDSEANLQFTIRGLNNLYDYNSGTHILNNNAYPGQKQISFRVLLNSSDTDEGDVAHVDPYVDFTSNVEAFFTSNNTLIVSNPINTSFDLYSKLENAPFYAQLYQPLLTNAFTDKSVYVSGTTLNTLKDYNVFSLTGDYTANIGYTVEDKRFISVYLDGTLQNQDAFTWDNKANITVSLSNTASHLRVATKIYTVPTIELGDNIFLIFNNTHSVINSSYHLNTSKYNAALSSNNIFRIYLADNLRVNATGFIATNISPNPYGTIGNVNTVANTFTLDYNDNLYPGNFSLANNHVYKIVKGNKFTPLVLTAGKTIYDVPPGFVTVRARNVNTAGRKSNYATATVEVLDLLMPAVTNLTVTETLYLDTTQGIATRAIVKFDHLPTKEILAYEVSYKIEAEDGTSTNFITVQVPITAIDSSGQINYIINNVDRGRSSGVNYLVVRVTPLNNSLTGVTKQIIHTVIGKTALPTNVTSFNYAQNSNSLTLFWSFLLNSDGTLRDLDLQEVEIRRVQGQLTTGSQYLAAWNTAQYIATIAIPSTNHSFSIDAYGTFTYLIKTRDTSRNESVDVAGISFTLQRPTNLSAYKTWSEDSPAANTSVAFMNNENYREYYWPCFANSDNGGLYYAVDDPITPGIGPSTLVENANGTSSGFSVAFDVSDLLIGANAVYQTQVRDIGTDVVGRLSTDINVYSILASTWLSMRENLVSGVSDNSTKSNVLWDDGSYIGQILLDNNCVYSNQNGTLRSNDSFGNVYAIWNSGQFGTDTSNANSFALIAGVINANAVALGATYLAGGIASGSNNLANLTTKTSSYQLVNLKQWGDPEGLGNWQGPDGLVSYNLEVRYSSSNVYFQSGNANVNVVSFTSSNTGTFQSYQSGEIEFRWFQLRVWITNLNPSLASAVIDKLRYTADLTTKIYQATVNVTSNPTYVDLSQQNFKSTPVITLTPIVDSPLRINNTFPSYSSIDSSATQANITMYSNTGTFVPNLLVNLTATGF